MTWMKLVQPDEKLELKMTDAERKVLLDGLPPVPAKCRTIIKRAGQSEPTLLTLQSLDDLSVALGTAWNCCDDKRVHKKLDAIMGKVRRLLDSHTDQADVPITKEQARKKVQKAMHDLLEGKNPGIISFTLKPSKKAGEAYPLKLTKHQRESVIHCTQSKRSIKQKFEQAGAGTQIVGVTRKELDELNNEIGQAVVCAPSPHKQRLIAVLNKVASFFEEERRGIFSGEAARPRKTVPAKSTDLLFQFKLTLLDVKPAIWRRIQLRDCTLAFLHKVIQVAMGWKNCHMHHFLIAGERFGKPAPDEFDFEPKIKDENRVLLSSLLPKTAKRVRWFYEYDCGDGWGHEVLSEGFPTLEKSQKYPLCLDGARACPPEDCGGPWGYADFLNAISNPRHEQHEDFLEWIGGEFDPEGFDLKAIDQEMRSVRGRP